MSNFNLERLAAVPIEDMGTAAQLQREIEACVLKLRHAIGLKGGGFDFRIGSETGYVTVYFDVPSDASRCCARGAQGVRCAGHVGHGGNHSFMIAWVSEK